MRHEALSLRKHDFTIELTEYNESCLPCVGQVVFRAQGRHACTIDLFLEDGEVVLRPVVP